MAIQQLRLYDVLVDIVPGVLSLFLLEAILGTGVFELLGRSSSGVQSAVILIVLGFITGRVLHYLSGEVSKVVARNLFMLKISQLEDGYAHRGLGILKKMVPVEDREEVIKWSLDYYPPEPDWYPQLAFPEYNKTIVRELDRELTDKYDFQMLGNLDDLVPFAHSKLYPHNRLYHRYNILTTFFRNAAFLAWAFAAVTGIQGLLTHTSIILVQRGSPWMNLSDASAIPLVSLCFGILFSVQLQKYAEKRNRHLIIDLYLTVKDE